MGIRDCRKCGRPFKVVVVDEVNIELVEEELTQRYDDLNLRMRSTRSGMKVVNECPVCGCVHGESYLEGEMGCGIIREVERFGFFADIRCQECGAQLDPPPSPSIKLCINCLNKMRYPSEEEIGLLVSHITCEALQGLQGLINYEFDLFESGHINIRTLREDVIEAIEGKIRGIHKEYGSNIDPPPKEMDPSKSSEERDIQGNSQSHQSHNNDSNGAGKKKDYGEIQRETRKHHRKAFLRWSNEDEEMLRRRYMERASVEELMEEFERTEKGILYRLKILGLIDDLIYVPPPNDL